MTVTDQLRTIKKQIADEFNNVFVNIGPQLADKIKYSGSKRFTDFLTNPTDKQFEFVEVSEDIVSKIIDSLPNKTSSSYGNISLKLLKSLKHNYTT